MRTACDAVPEWKGWLEHLHEMAATHGDLAALPLSLAGASPPIWRSQTPAEMPRARAAKATISLRTARREAAETAAVESRASAKVRTQRVLAANMRLSLLPGSLAPALHARLFTWPPEAGLEAE